MTVYVDKIMYYPDVKPAAQKYGNHWCHMTASSTAELLSMARKIQLSPSHIQKSTSGILHFDLTPSKRALAIRFGAKEVSTVEMVRIMRGEINDPPDHPSGLPTSLPD